MQIHLKIIGVLCMALALVHIIFPKYFHWKKELRSLSLVNKQMMEIHTIFIAVTVFLMGLLCVSSATEIIETSLGKKIALGLGVFWLLRLIIQFVGYSSKLWKGKTFETTVHVVFSIFWLYVTVIFFITALGE
ncbi:hypothetical protein [uncultured Maribacter sp.]|uniref:hypothetical protein n=1 Tax=uncultured Maribacter sp. TaxID=431308 RepID=UPI00263A2CAA|nr:hypothetical protein [uncultured Maribacter sp.]